MSRAYSIASAPRADGTIDIAITRVEGGPGSQYLHEIPVGTVLRMTDAQGFFTLEPLARPVVMVGTGTGVSPLRSMLHAAYEQGVCGAPFALVFGVRTEGDILYREAFEALERAWPVFRWAPTLSRPSEGWAGRRGYVQVHLPEIIRELGGDCDVYVCGLNRMIKEVRALLKERLGYTRQRIHTERYD